MPKQIVSQEPVVATSNVPDLTNDLAALKTQQEAS